MNAFQMLFVPLCLGMALLVLLQTWRGRISRRQGAFWILLWLAGAAFIAVPHASVVLAAWLGIGRGSDLVFYLAIVAGLTAALHFHSRCRRLETLITELMRQEAIQRPERGGEPSDGKKS